MADDLKCSAVPRRFSPDMKVRWLPTIDGEIIVGGTLPFSGFDKRSEAIEAARLARQQRAP